jgi:hypothetical protein
MNAITCFKGYKLDKIFFQIITCHVNGEQSHHSASVNALKEVRNRALDNSVMFLVILIF